MKRPRTLVSDHALVRYLERVQGWDIARLKAEIGRRIDEGARAGATAVLIDGWAYQIGRDPAGKPIVTTVTEADAHHYCPPKRRPQARPR